MISDGSGEVGACKLTGEVLSIMQNVPGLVKNMTGVDISTQIARAGGGLTSRVKITAIP